MNCEIWTKDNCPFCVKAKRLLLNRGAFIKEMKIGDNCTREDLLAKVPSARSVPQIFIDGELIGGYKELEWYFETKE